MFGYLTIEVSIAIVMRSSGPVVRPLAARRSPTEEFRVLSHDIAPDPHMDSVGLSRRTYDISI